MEQENKHKTTNDPQSGKNDGDGHAKGQAAGQGGNSVTSQNPNASEHTQNQQQGNSEQFHERGDADDANFNRDPDGSGETRAGQQPGNERPI